MRSKQRRTYKGEPRSPEPPSSSKVSPLSQQLELLTRQNKELKQEIIELKVHQFYHFDDNKLKELISQVEGLRKEVKTLKDQVKELQTVNDFLKRTNTHLKAELEKEISSKRKELKQRGTSKTKSIEKTFLKDENSRLLKESKMMASKQTDHTRNTDCSQDELSHMTCHPHFYLLQNTTLDEALNYRDPPPAQYHPSQQPQRQPRKSLMEKILSPRRGKERSPNTEGNQYLLYRRQKDRQPKD